MATSLAGALESRPRYRRGALGDGRVSSRRLLRDEHGAICMSRDSAGDASEDRSRDGAAAAKADDDEVDVPIVREAHDLVRGIALEDLELSLDSSSGREGERLGADGACVVDVRREHVLKEGRAEHSRR